MRVVYFNTNKIKNIFSEQLNYKNNSLPSHHFLGYLGWQKSITNFLV